MRLFRILRDRLRSLIGRDAVADEIQEEIRFHLDARIRDLEQRGMSRAAAREHAIRKFGNPSVIQDRGYDVRGGGFMESIIQDVRFGIRLLWRQRAFSLVALATLALGTGATTAIFCVADAALIRPLPYDKPEQLVRLNLAAVTRPDQRFSGSLEDMDQWKVLTQVFSHMASATNRSVTQLGGSDPEKISVTTVTTDYLPMYDLTPLFGRAFSSADERLGAPPVALLGYRYWKSRFQGNPNVVGQTLTFSNDTAMIIGVLRDDTSRVQTKIYMPLQATDERRAARQYSIVARIRDGVTMTQAQRELDVLSARLSRERPEFKGFRASLTSVLDSTVRSSQTMVNILLGAVGFVLLIACVNVASLQLARGASRQTELAVRAAIGAGRARLIRQLVTESVVLALAGSALGALLAWLVLDTLVSNIPISLNSAVSVSVNWRVLGLTAALATLCGVVFGLLPAFRSSKADLNEVLGRSARGGRTTLSKAAGSTLIAIEVAAAILLVTGSALMIRSFVRMSAVPLGFDSHRFVTMDVTPVDNRPEVFGPYYAALLDRIRHLPGVEVAGGTNSLPLGGGTSYSNVQTVKRREGAVLQQVTPGYFETLGVPLHAGRYPNGADVSAGSWIVLSDRAASQMFPNESAIGSQVKHNDVWHEVIGVVGNVESRGVLRPLDGAQVYLPYSPAPTVNFSSTGRVNGQPLTIVVHANAPVAGLTTALRDAAKSIGTPVMAPRIRQGREWWADSVTTPRQRTVLLGILGGLGLLLALVGVFGVTQFSVARRIPEIGVRIAFGANPGQVVATMMKDAAVPIGAGIGIGLAGAFFMTKVIAAFLFKTEPRDPWAFAAAALVLAGCGVLAAWLPARRAARIDPVIALRGD